MVEIVTRIFLVSETKFRMNNTYLVARSRISHPNKPPPCKPYVYIAEDKKPC